MQPTIIQQIPLAFLAVAMNPHLPERQGIATGSAVSMEWCVSSSMPTQSFVLPAIDDATPVETEPVLPLVALAGAVLAESRSLTDWERKDADEFFWSQFS